MAPRSQLLSALACAKPTVCFRHFGPGCSDPNATYQPRETAVDQRYEKVAMEVWAVVVEFPGPRGSGPVFSTD